MTDDRTIADLGELALIQQLQPFCAAEQLGDDAAVLAWIGVAHPTDQLVITTDVLVDGVHFSDRTTSPADIGWRATAANLSDLAAMGATAIGVTVGLSVPPTTRLTWVKDVYQGITACLDAFGGAIVGGDVCRSPVAMVSITAFGRVAPNQVLRRNAAQPGDLLVTTGRHGAARAGLELLLNPTFGTELDPTVKAQWIQAHQRPIPRFDLLPQLWAGMAAIGSGDRVLMRPLAAMDSSDGLANAVLHICQQSRVGAELWRSQLPLPPEFTQVLGSEQALEWCLYGGEDFELVLSLPPELAHWLIAQQVGCNLIGEIVSGSIVTVAAAAEAPTLTLSFDQSFQHF